MTTDDQLRAELVRINQLKESAGAETDISTLAKSALADDAQTTPKPWRMCGASDGKCPCKLLWSIPCDRTVVSVAPEGQYLREEADVGTHADLAFIAAARTREPKLAGAVLELIADRDAALARARRAEDDVVGLRRVFLAAAAWRDSLERGPEPGAETDAALEEAVGAYLKRGDRS